MRVDEELLVPVLSQCGGGYGCPSSRYPGEEDRAENEKDKPNLRAVLHVCTGTMTICGIQYKDVGTLHVEPRACPAAIRTRSPRTVVSVPLVRFRISPTRH